MYKEIVKVHGEDFLETKAINATAVTGTNVLVADGTLGAIVAYVIASTAVTVASGKNVVVTMKASDTKTGTFETVASMTVAAGNYEAGQLIGSITLPYDVKKYVKAELASDTTNTGQIRVTGGYLPR